MGYVTINITLVAFIVASVAYVMKEVWKPEILRKGSIAIFIVAFALNTVTVPMLEYLFVEQERFQFFLKEKISRLQTVGIVIVTIGVIIFSFV